MKLLLGNVTSLRTLILPGNCLVRLPESTGKLANLESMFLMDNMLSDLPSSMRCCKNLRYGFRSKYLSQTVPTIY